MPHTYTQLTYHIVFGTKDRVPYITEAMRPRLVDASGRECIVFEVSPDGSARICLLRPDGKTALGMAIDADGRPGLVISYPHGPHPHGETAFEVGMDVNGAMGLRIFDKQGKCMWQSVENDFQGLR